MRNLLAAMTSPWTSESSLFARAGQGLARFLARPDPAYRPVATSDPRLVATVLKPADVLLVEGNTRFSTAIKYLTQSTWSHATLYLGTGPFAGRSSPWPTLIEADVVEGIRLVPLEVYEGRHIRICRPIGLEPAEIDRLVEAALSRLGHQYDLRNIIDLVRYLLPTPPVPVRWRRRMLALGSGEPTRAICSTFIAQLFQGIRYPILPDVEQRPSDDPGCRGCVDEVLHVRHHSLFVPRDFDVSPYFRIVKPAVEHGFDFRRLNWSGPR